MKIGPGLGFTLGSLAGAVVYFVGMFGVSPRTKRIAKLGADIHAAGGSPTPEQGAEMQKLDKELSRFGYIDFVLVMNHSYQLAALLVIVPAFFLFARASQTKTTNPVVLFETTSESPKEFNMEFTLKSTADSGKLAYIGVGGQIDGIINPDLAVQPSDFVRVILVNGGGLPHDLYLPDLDAKTAYVSKIGEQTEIVFEMSDMEPGIYIYYCMVPGHRQAGQEGKFIVENAKTIMGNIR